MKKNMKIRNIGMGAAALAVCMAGCKNYDDYRSERAEYAIKHFEKANWANIDESRSLGLIECIRLALENNLDMKVFNLEQNVAREMLTAEMLGMLPELNVSNNLTDRENTPASSSRKVSGDGITYGASTSQDETVNYFNLDLALSIVDFGLAFFNSQQAHDRVLLRTQRTQRAAQNLSLDVVRVYFQVAAAQRAINITKQLLEDCRSRYDLIAEMGRTRQITPFRAFDETRRFIDMEKRLTNYIRSYENSCVELRSLMGIYPSGLIQVDDSILDRVPEFNMPETILLEQIALLQRPELYEIDLQKHINVLECRKTLVMMFPNVRIFIDFTNSNNSFLYHQSWWEIGVRAAYNLLKLPQHIARYRAYSTQVEAEETRSYAQAIGIMAQVRMAQANMLATKERFDIDTKVNKTYQENLDWALANRQTTGQLSQLELDHMRLVTAETEIEKYLSLGNYYISYYRILNTLGLNTLAKAPLEDLQRELAEARVRAEAELAKSREEFDQKTLSLNEELSNSKTTPQAFEKQEKELEETVKESEEPVREIKPDAPKEESEEENEPVTNQVAMVSIDRLMGI